MNTVRVISAMCGVLGTVVFVQGASGEDSAERVAFENQQVRLVDSYRNTGDYRAAERVLREWLPLEPAGSDSRLMVQNSLADMLREEGYGREARLLFAQTLDSPRVIWQLRLSALIGMADVDLGQGDFQASIDGWSKALISAREKRDT